MLLAPILLVCLAASAAEEQAERLPTPPSRAQVMLLTPQKRAAAAAAMKRVMFHRYLRLRDDRHRLTQENAAECAAMAEQLEAPSVFAELLKREAAAPLSGRDLYEHRQALQQILSVYEVDELQIRLFVESMHYPAAALSAVVDALPIEPLFNLLPTEKTDMSTMQEQLLSLASIYAKQAELYKGISNREQADAAASDLPQLLDAFHATAHARFMVAAQRDKKLLHLYERTALPARLALNAQRRNLLETAYFGSVRLAVLDYLLN